MGCRNWKLKPTNIGRSPLVGVLVVCSILLYVHIAGALLGKTIKIKINPACVVMSADKSACVWSGPYRCHFRVQVFCGGSSYSYRTAEYVIHTRRLSSAQGAVRVGSLVCRYRTPVATRTCKWIVKLKKKRRTLRVGKKEAKSWEEGSIFRIKIQDKLTEDKSHMFAI